MDTSSKRRKAPRNKEMVIGKERKKKALHTVNLLTLVELHFKSSGENSPGVHNLQKKGSTQQDAL